MNTLPKISIIIPIYNVEEYITECLQSVMRQTYQGAIECILVDDCGTDNSIAVAEQLIADYHGPIESRILHHDHNRGLSAARNTGTDVATGDYIYYLDSDDYISDDCLLVLAEPLKEKEYDMVVGDYKMFGDRNDPTLLVENRSEIIGNDTIFESYADRKIYVMAWNKLCKRSFLKGNNITFLEGQLHEDELWTYRVMMQIQSLAIVHTITYWYRVRSMSIATDTSRAEAKVRSYEDTIQEIHLHPHANRIAYIKCLLYYWNLFFYYAFLTGAEFKAYYMLLRKSCPYKPNVIDLFKYGKKAFVGYKRKVHFLLPPQIGYRYVCACNSNRGIVKSRNNII